MMNESVKKSIEKSKNVLEEKRKTLKRKICIKNTHVYNNCYEVRSRAIKKLYTKNPHLKPKVTETKKIKPLFFKLKFYWFSVSSNFNGFKTVVSMFFVQFSVLSLFVVFFLVLSLSLNNKKRNRLPEWLQVNKFLL